MFGNIFVDVFGVLGFMIFSEKRISIWLLLFNGKMVDLLVDFVFVSLCF